MSDKSSSRTRHRNIGASALKRATSEDSSATKPKKTKPKNARQSISDTATTKKVSFLRRLDIRLPWLKIIAILVVGLFAILDLLDVTISKTNDPYDKIRIAPMSRHVRTPERPERILDGKMLVALTFDDGPSATTTPLLLDILHQKNVPATFFMLGNMARNNQDLVRRAATEGHEVASHTMSHQNLIRIPAAAVQSDISESATVFKSIFGHSPTLTRPPYGNINDAVRSAVGTPIILWSVDTLDWKNKDVNSIVSNTLNQVHDGAIVLMHDIYSTTIESVPIIIDKLRDLGYEFVTVPELAQTRNVNLSSGTTYYNFRP